MSGLLADYALVDLERAREWVWGKANEDRNDDKLERVVNVYSRAAMDVIGRELAPKGTAEATLGFRYGGGGSLRLGRYEARSITTVTLHADQAGSEWELTSADYAAFPENGSPAGTYLWLALPKLNLSPTRANLGGTLVEVAGLWGPNSVPEAAQQAVLIAVKHALVNPEGMAARSLGAMDFSVVQQSPEEAVHMFPPHARSLLDTLRYVVPVR